MGRMEPLLASPNPIPPWLRPPPPPPGVGARSAPGRGAPSRPRRHRILSLGALLGLLLAGATGVVPALGADDPEAVALRRRLTDDDPAARAAAVRRLVGEPLEGAFPLVLKALADPHPYVRGAAAGVFGLQLDRVPRERLLREGPGLASPLAREALTETFAVWADRDGRTGLLRLLGDKEASVRAEAARRLGADPDPASGAALLHALGDPDGLVRARALDAWEARRKAGGTVNAGGAGGRPGAGPPEPSAAIPWRQFTRDKDARVRLSALEGSVAVGGETAVFAVEHGLQDAVWTVRLVAAELAGTVRDRRVLAPLVAALSDPRERVAAAAGRSLVRLTGIPFDPNPARWRSWLTGDGASFDPAGVEPRAPQPFDAAGSTVATLRLLDLPVASTHVAFVLDASGSMAVRDATGTSRWDRVRAEMDRVLAALGGAAEGTVVLFADEAIPILPAAVRFTPGVRAQVRDALAARGPGGRTALSDGILRALADPAVDTVLVLSDGAPSGGSHFTKTDLREAVRDANRWRRARIDVLSIGTDEVSRRWRTLLSEVASESGGTFVVAGAKSAAPARNGAR